MKSSQKFCIYDVLLNWHLHWTLPIILFHGNSLQNMFYRKCPVFSTCVSYATLCNFALNFWSHLCSLTANQECKMCGIEKDNWYTMMKTICTKLKLGARLYAVKFVLTLAVFPSCSWAFIQQVWYSSGSQTVLVEFDNNISESMFGKFLSQRFVFIPGMCTVPCNQSIKCQVHCFEMSHMWPLCNVECQLADRLRSCRLWMWEIVHGGAHYIWHPPAELFHIINEKTATWIFILEKLRF